MSLFDRIAWWRRSRAHHATSIREARATCDALAANIAGLARAMEERFISIAERIDSLGDAHAVRAAEAVDALASQLDAALGVSHAPLVEEARVAHTALAASISGLARTMDDRFASVAERIDGLKEAQAPELGRAAEVLSYRVNSTIGELHASLNAQLDRIVSEVTLLRGVQDLAPVLHGIKRDLGAQFSLASYDIAMELQAMRRSIDDRPDPGAPSQSA